MNKSESIQIMCFRFVNPYPVQKICLVDLFCPTMFYHFMDLIHRYVFKRFVSWIQFVMPKISKYSILIDSEGFVYKSRQLD
jgi:hypothetical protein